MYKDDDLRVQNAFHEDVTRVKVKQELKKLETSMERGNATLVGMQAILSCQLELLALASSFSAELQRGSRNELGESRLLGS